MCASPALSQDTASPAPSQATADLLQQFQDPPQTARPRVWWHWINGNITAEGLEKDLEWMKRVGIGGAQSFDVNLASPQIVDKRLVYMTPEWKQAFRAAARKADSLGIELSVASSPGWSETGGPWVAPADAMKKLVWSETDVRGGRALTVKLPAPPNATGPYQSIVSLSGTGSAINRDGPKMPDPYYHDALVLAVPIAKAPAVPAPVATDSEGKTLNLAAMVDDSLETSTVLTEMKKGATTLDLAYSAPQTMRSATLFVQGGAGSAVGGHLEVSLEARGTDGNWSPVTTIPLGKVPTTVSFAPVTASSFRLSFTKKQSLPDFTPPPPGVNVYGLASAFGGLSPKPGIAVAELRLTPEARVDQSEVKAGFAVVPDYYSLSKGLADTRGAKPGAVIDVTSHMRPDGTLDWRAPKGNWRILRLGYSLIGKMNSPAPAEATGLEVDKYDADAVRRYMEHYIANYRDAAGADMIGKQGVRAILNDSIEVGSANWTPEMVGQFKRLRGYDPTPWLPALTGTIIGSRAESDRFLYDFRRTLADLLASAHYGTVAEVAHENGLKVYTEALEDLRPQIGEDMAMRSHADVPMGAMWYYPEKAGPKTTYLADLKGASSVGHLYGRSAVGAESLTSIFAPWALGPRELKHVIDQEFALGITLPSIHTSVHVPTDDKQPGLRLGVFGQDFNRNAAWAELARPWVDYIARNSLMLQQGRNVADIAYFFGEEAPLTGLYGEHPVAGIPKTNAFDFVNADALTGAFTNDSGDLVTTGGARYRLLYLGGTSRYITLDVLRAIDKLVEGGATVVGTRPQGDPGLYGDQADYDVLLTKLWPGTPVAQVGKGRVIATSDLAEAMREADVSADFSYTGADDSPIAFVHRRTQEGDIYFLSNPGKETATIEARFRVTGKAAELWHAETGTSEPVSFAVRNDETLVPLTLRGDQSVFVVFRKPHSGTGQTVTGPALGAPASIDGPWQVSFEAGRGAPAATVLPKLAPLNENADPGIKYFSGIATYTHAFKTPRGWKPGQRLILDLGAAYEIAEVTVNGKLAGYAWHAPYTVDIGAYAKSGKNQLQVRVANLWANRLIGDAQCDENKIGWTSMPMYLKNAPLRPSGLIGPVRLLQEK